MSRTLLLVRHCESEANRAGALEGYPDAPLTELGRAQALSLAERIARWDLKTPRLVTSPLRRALHTAEAIASKLLLAPLIDMRLCAGEARPAQSSIEAGLEVAGAIKDLWLPADDPLIVVSHRFPLRAYLERLYSADAASGHVSQMANGDVLEIAFEEAERGHPRHHPLAG